MPPCWLAILFGLIMPPWAYGNFRSPAASYWLDPHSPGLLVVLSVYTNTAERSAQPLVNIPTGNIAKTTSIIFKRALPTGGLIQSPSQ
jgi:hypothetical protein